MYKNAFRISFGFPLIPSHPHHRSQPFHYNHLFLWHLEQGICGNCPRKTRPTGAVGKKAPEMWKRWPITIIWQCVLKQSIIILYNNEEQKQRFNQRARSRSRAVVSVAPLPFAAALEHVSLINSCVSVYGCASNCTSSGGEHRQGSSQINKDILCPECKVRKPVACTF